MDAEDDDTIEIGLNLRERLLIVNGLRAMWNMHVYTQIAVSTKYADSDPAYQKALEISNERLRELRLLADRFGVSIFDSATK